MLIQCCVCRRIQRDDNWEASAKHYHDAIHTYCPTCAKTARAEIEAYKKSYKAQLARQVRMRSLQELFQRQGPMKRLEADGTA